MCASSRSSANCQPNPAELRSDGSEQITVGPLTNAAPPDNVHLIGWRIGFGLLGGFHGRSTTRFGSFMTANLGGLRARLST